MVPSNSVISAIFFLEAKIVVEMLIAIMDEATISFISSKFAPFRESLIPKAHTNDQIRHMSQPS